MFVNHGMCDLFQKPVKMDLLPNLQQRDRSRLLIREYFIHVLLMENIHAGSILKCGLVANNCSDSDDSYLRVLNIFSFVQCFSVVV